MASVSSPHGDDSLMGFEEEDDSVIERKLKSAVWNSFKRVKKSTGEYIAICDHCNASLCGDKGTSHLKKHLSRKHGELIADSESTSNIKNYKFDQGKSRKDLATMVIKHNYPLSIVEHHWFKIYCRGLNPDFNIISRNTLRSNIISIHKEEKEKMYAFLENLRSKVTLTTDIWTSDHQNIAYACLTAHFIDDKWDLHKKILIYRKIEYPHDGETLFRFIRELILEWNIDKKIFAMVVDNVASNDVMVRKVRSWLNERSLLSLSGDLFHVRCSAHILSLVVQDGLGKIQGLIEKIRKTVRYLKSSTYAKQKFDYAVNQVRLKGRKKLPSDVPNRWNSTYLMLQVAISIREAFSRLTELDRNYIYNPTDEEWEIATTIKDCLEGFYNATKHFSGSTFPTSNVFSPDVCDLHLDLCKWERSKINYLREFAVPMKEKFVKYWDECCLVLALVLVFDPRFKLKVVQYYYEKLYGKIGAVPYVKRVRDAYDGLYVEYNTTHGDICDSEVCSNTVRSNDKYTGFDEWCDRDQPQVDQQKLEADAYLDSPLFPRGDEFCVLQWWKSNACKYPVISKIARDVLAVPATTVASESAFSVGGRVIDETRSSMLPELVEALVTTDDWIGNVQNKLIKFELLLTTSTFLATVFAVVIAVFGMNFEDDIFDEPNRFDWVVSISATLCGILYIASDCDAVAIMHDIQGYPKSPEDELPVFLKPVMKLKTK